MNTNVYFNDRIQETNTLNPEQKLKHIDTTMKELKELYYTDSSNIIDMSNILRNLKELYAIKLPTEQFICKITYKHCQ